MRKRRIGLDTVVGSSDEMKQKSDSAVQGDELFFF
jgi:hypothetical protein